MEDIIETLAESHVLLPLECIRAFQGQPRTYFDKDALYRLSLSIKQRGQKQPIQVKRLDGKDSGVDYEIVDGERRWRACQLAKVPTIKAIVINVTDEEEQFEISAISNFGKADHTALEIANAVKRIRDNRKLTMEEIADGFSMSRNSIYNYLSLLNLDSRVQDMLSPLLPEEKKLRMNIALTLSKLNSKESQFKYATYILRNNMNVVQARAWLNKITARTDLRASKSSNKPRDDFRSLQRIVITLLSNAEYAVNLRQGDYNTILWNKTQYQVNEIVESLDEVLKQLVVLQKLVGDVVASKSKKSV